MSNKYCKTCGWWKEKKCTLSDPTQCRWNWPSPEKKDFWKPILKI